MSSGKLRRERSRSQERHSHTEGHRRSSADQEDVPELNEEEYDEEWEHEWEDIDEIGSNNPNYHRPYGRNSHMKWRGRNQYRGQNRFQNWDYRNRSTGSDHGSDNSRKTGRKNHAEEEESLEMPPGEEMTNLKVKIQDGKRFAEPDEKNDFENVTGMKSQPRFFRGRGHRGYHNVSRDKWVPQFNNKRQFEPVDCREVLNRRKRHHPDTLESDLREKLLRKDSDLGDLREIIESRDTGPSDLMDIIEPPDLSLVEELGEDVGEIGRMEEINLKVPNEYYNDGIGKNRNYEIEDESGHYEFTGEEEATDDAPPDDVHEHHTQTETWPEDEWELGRRRSRERSFCRLEEWRGKRGHDNEWRGSRSRLATSEDRLDHPVSPKLSFDNHNTSVDRDPSRNRSGDGSRRSLSGNLREKNFVHAIRPRDLSWDSERNVGRILPMEGLPNFKTDSETRNNVDKGLRMTLREDGGRDFSQERSRKFDEDDERFPIGNQDHKTLKSPLSSGSRPLDRKIRSHRSGSRSRNSSREPHRIVSEKVRRSSERTRRTRSISGERRSRDASHERIRGVCRERNGSLLEKSKNCLFQSSGQKKLVGERNRTGDGDFRVGQRDNVNREIIQERGRLRDGERDLFGQGSRVGDRGMIQERRRSSNREIEDRQRGDDRITVRYTSSDFMRTRSLSRERDGGFDKNRKSSPVRGGARVTRWGPERNPWLPGHEPGAISGRDREKSPVWGGPRTPSVERFRDVGWQSGKSPDRNQLRSRERERSRSRERQRAVSADRTRGDSRGRQIQGRNNVKDKDLSRLKETDRRENIQETQRRRNLNLDKDSNVRQNRICEPGPKLMRHAEKETFTNMRVDRIHKREHEEDLCKDRAREKPRSPDNRSKKTSQVIRGDFKERFVREAEKSLKCSRQDEFIKKSGRENLQQEVSGGHSLKDSREWENIRDFQERRNPQPIIGLPFLDESRRLESTHDLKARGQDSGTPRSLQQSLDSSSGNRTKKDQSTNWRDSKNRQSYERSEGERHRSSQWSSPNRRSKPSDHPESNKSASHSMQSTSSSHHSSSNGKTDNDFWRRNLPSLGESHWNKPRSDL